MEQVRILLGEFEQIDFLFSWKPAENLWFSVVVFFFFFGGGGEGGGGLKFN